ncbi:amino acid adenylation domain-containing protein [Plectonema cf. radiosum LEGE 06105]|uniref:Amino acid adenylation domain-containing protein n=1 Tax=Plectonema cf. radiosum LEGE 06105 TaxID=945769 RepID=A0A8J7JUE8_9CYAN|nr:non-ribosomal peptide synthetase [Plectonema radiosum]MBE9214964.1 amino acid adenylation domain-containing protein [Plectonema cf. radiosum LEGE 06105]
MDNIIDLYELSPMQQGMLFHSLYSPESAIYFEQRSCKLKGNLNIRSFKTAWQKVIERHTILRTAFYWEEVEKPLQVVHNQVELPMLEEHWQGLTINQQTEKLEEFLQADRQQGFDLNQPPLMRCALLQIQTDEYYFVWSHHHLLMDGWCNGILLKEVFSFYQTAISGKSLFLPPPRPYRDYIEWLQQQDIAFSEQFWRDKLKGFTAPTPLIKDSPTIISQQGIVSEQQIKLPIKLTTELDNLAKQHRLTLNTIAQGIWAILLCRYSGENDIVFGATVSGRPPNLPGVESIVGLFINTLPVRVNLSGEEDLLPWLQQLQTQQIEQESLSYSSLIDIQQWSDVPPGVGLFESLVIFENYPVSIDAVLQSWSNDLQISQTRGFERTNYPLSLTVIPDTELSLRINYDSNRFESTTIIRMLGHLETLVQGIVTNPQQKLCELPLLTATEKQQLLVEWNDTNCDYSNLCIHQLIAAQAESTPDKIAVVFESQQLTYKELNQKANQLAHYLKSVGVEEETRVGICLERSEKMLVGLLGILKAGGTYIPLDPAFPEERLTFMLEDSGVNFLVTDSKTSPLTPLLVKERGTMVINVDSDWELIAQQPTHSPSFKRGLGGSAYIIYTSGSTGKPKGVQIMHKSLVNCLESMQQQPAIDVNDTFLSVTTLSFDIAGLELYLPLITGARLIIASREIATDGTLLKQNLDNNQVTIMQATPATWRLLLSAGWKGNQQLKILCGGEALDVNLAEELLKCSKEVWNLYGPTEATIWSSVAECRDAIYRVSTKTVPIGKPINNTQFYVLDDCLQPVPIGVPGELYIGGAGLAKGYLNKPELTAERFVDNPFYEKTSPPSPLLTKERGVRQDGVRLTDLAEIQNSRLYKTGDKVRYLSDGNLEYLGRIDYQIKLRGFRIELGEIEAVLTQHPSVKQAVVTLYKNLDDERLIAYFVSSSEVSQVELRQFLQDKLPAYMVPSNYIMLEEFPLTPNCKIDRKALPLPDKESQTLTYTPPRTVTEEIVAGIWAEVLNLQQISIDDNFFELGGHSLLATRVISQIRQAFTVELPLRSLFENPTIAELSLSIETATRHSVAPPIKPVPREENLPLSFAQQRLWFLCQLEPDSPYYNIPAAVRLTGFLDIDALQQSFNDIIRRHETLRTAFLSVDGKPTQQIHSVDSLPFSIIDLSNIPDSKRETKVEELSRIEAMQPFKLDSSPLLRVKLLQLSDRDYVILLTFHHIIADGWSIGVLVRELGILYQEKTSPPSPLLNKERGVRQDGLKSPLLNKERGVRQDGVRLELPIQYADFTVWQREWLQGEVLENQLNYWHLQLQDAPILLELPTDYPRPAVRSLRGDSYTFKISPELTVALKRLSQQSGCTLFMTLLAAFQTLLYRYTGNEDIVVGTSIANRNYPEIEGLIGFFVNTLALRTDLSENPTFEELLNRVREVSLGAYAHQDLPFEQLIDNLKLQRSLNYTPLFQVMFVLQNAPMEALEIEGLHWQPLESNSSTAKFDLTLSMHETLEGLTGVLEYSLDLFNLKTIERIAENYLTLLTAIINQPEQQISELPILTVSEQQLFIEWNQTAIEYPRDKCVHQLFEEQVAQTPNNTALVWQNQELNKTYTYDELNIKVNQLAHHLIGLGVKPQTPVGIYLERSPEAIIGILAILKAGGIYVPLDPAYPQERLNFMLEDAGVKVLITNSKTSPPTPLLSKERGDETSVQTPLLNKERGDEAQLYRGEVINLDNNWEIINQNSAENPIELLTPENLAYIMYTSGSTGIPKGVCTTHRGIVRLVKSSNYVNLSAEEIILQAAPISFDASTFEIWGALLNGGKLVLLPTQKLSLKELGETLEKYHISTLWLTAGLFHLMVDEQPQSLKGVRQLLAGGDVISPIHAQKLQQIHPNCQLINGYGPTESTTFACCYSIPKNHPADKPIPIGYPISNTQVYILDNYLQPVPIGVPGELYISGDGLARGYLNRAELTAEKFIPNPFFEGKTSPPSPLLTKERGVRKDGVRLYKTGDRVRYRGDGAIEYLGRFDNQVKIRGFRVELGEVETALSQHPQVQEVVVILQNQDNIQRLVAYVVSTEEITNTNLRSFLSDKLPEYLIPSIFISLPKLPLTANGKVNRRALPNPDITTSENEFVTPTNLLETTLAQIWKDILRLEKVGINDNFFELGGDSILAIQIISRANQAGIQITPKQLFQYQTIAELATIATQTPSIQAEQGIITGFVPLTPIQHWFFEQQKSNPHHFNQAVLLKVKTKLDLNWLEQALQELLLHHDALRLRFKQTESGWKQFHFEPSSEVPFTCFDISKLTELQQQNAITNIANQIQKSLNLSTGSVIRVALFNLGENQASRLLFVIHHLVIDGVSWRILLSDLQTAYEQLSQGKVIQLSLKTTSFKEWAEHLQTYANSSEISNFSPHLSSSKSEELTKDFPNTIANSEQIEIILSPEHTQALLKEVPIAYNTQINDILLTALVQTFAQLTGKSSLLIDLEGHGRTELFDNLNLSRTIGWFTNIVPVNLDLEELSDINNLGEAIKHIKEQLRIPNNGIDYSVWRYLKQDKIQSVEFPSPEISFNYLGQFDSILTASNVFEIAQESPGLTQDINSERPYILEINGSIIEEQLKLTWTYNQHFYDKSVIDNIGEKYLEILIKLIEHCQSSDAGGYTPSDFLLAEIEQNQLDDILNQVDFK